jgi:NADH-quinone oxidoreductase subunit N
MVDGKMDPRMLQALLPYLCVFSGILIALILSVVRSRNVFHWISYLCMGVCLLGMLFSGNRVQEPILLFDGMLVFDAYTQFAAMFFLAITFFMILSSLKYLERQKLSYSEYPILLLFSALGMMVLSASLDLVVFFIALELMSLCVYVLVGFQRVNRLSNEASMKYFILGSVASAILLYGVAFLYGDTGTLNLQEMVNFLLKFRSQESSLFYLGVILMTCGFFMKTASFPFHAWMPEVYEGAPVSVTGWMSTAVKAAFFIAWIRIFSLFKLGFLGSMQVYFHDLFWISAFLTMLVGNCLALFQKNLKRLMGASSIAHTGYLLLGILSASHLEDGYTYVLFYIVVYVVANIGIFSIFALLAGSQDTQLMLSDLAGLGKRRPCLAVFLTFFMLSLAGIPLTAGFMSKYFLFYFAVQAREVILVILAILTSAISVYYYLRILVWMYMHEGSSEQEKTSHDLGAWISASLAFALVIQMGFFPAWMMKILREVVFYL